MLGPSERCLLPRYSVTATTCLTLTPGQTPASSTTTGCHQFKIIAAVWTSLLYRTFLSIGGYYLIIRLDPDCKKIKGNCINTLIMWCGWNAEFQIKFEDYHKSIAIRSDIPYTVISMVQSLAECEQKVQPNSNQSSSQFFHQQSHHLYTSLTPFLWQPYTPIPQQYSHHLCLILVCQKWNNSYKERIFIS